MINGPLPLLPCGGWRRWRHGGGRVPPASLNQYIGLQVVLYTRLMIWFVYLLLRHVMNASLGSWLLVLSLCTKVLRWKFAKFLKSHFFILVGLWEIFGQSFLSFSFVYGNVVFGQLALDKVLIERQCLQEISSLLVFFHLIATVGFVRFVHCEKTSVGNGPVDRRHDEHVNGRC